MRISESFPSSYIHLLWYVGLVWLVVIGLHVAGWNLVAVGVSVPASIVGACWAFSII